MKLLQKIRQDLKQFGVYHTLRHIFFRIIRPFYWRHDTILFAMKSSGGNSFPDDVVDLQHSNLEELDNITPAEKIFFSALLDAGNSGVAVIANKQLCGSAWIQEKGLYSFGKVGKMRIPEECAVVKNVYVNPAFRGRGIGGKLDQVCLSRCAGKTVFAFIIPENRFAIRNWKKHGMQPVLSIRLERFFKGKYQIKLQNIPSGSVCSFDFQKLLFVDEK